MKKIIEKEQGEFPIKKTVAIIFIVLWNIILLSDILLFILQNEVERIPTVNGVKIFAGLLLLTSILTLSSNRFRKIILKEGKVFEDIKKLAYFFIFLSIFMFLIMTIISNL